MNVQILQALFALIFLGNLIAFAGVDPISRLITAAIAVVFAIQLRRLPAFPRSIQVTIGGLAVLVFVQLLPLPHVIRALVQPGFAEVSAPGWAPLSLAPWGHRSDDFISGDRRVDCLPGGSNGPRPEAAFQFSCW